MDSPVQSGRLIPSTAVTAQHLEQSLLHFYSVKTTDRCVFQESDGTGSDYDNGSFGAVVSNFTW